MLCTQVKKLTSLSAAWCSECWLARSSQAVYSRTRWLPVAARRRSPDNRGNNDILDCVAVHGKRDLPKGERRVLPAATRASCYLAVLRHTAKRKE